jgi:hypothetical protein
VLYNEHVHGLHMHCDETPGVVHQMTGAGSSETRVYAECGRRLAWDPGGTRDSGKITRKDVNCMACIAATTGRQ